MSLLDVLNEIHRTLGQIRHELGKIQGELVEIRGLSYRVSMLEQNQAWLKGGWGRVGCGVRVPVSRNIRKVRTYV